MTLLHRTGRSAEIELKLGLPMADPAQLVPALLRVPALARCASEHRQVHNIYYDTPDRRLQAQRMALRIRRVGPDEAPQWLQTLKTADSGHSALSQRGEWEVSVPGPVLLQAVLREAPPWRHFDPEGRVFQALTPCFSTVFERTVWTVQGRDGSAIEVALDRGQITAGPHSAPLHELELELLAGPPAALFALARQIARRLAVLPLAASKAQRGQALRDGVLAAPRRASPPPLRHLSNGAAMARPVLGEMLGQFGANLYLLATEDDPEVVHQARVGWRRFRSALRLFRPLLNPPDPRLWQGLQPLLERLGAL
ncbi:MAG: inorganic triphosphatase, partial [Burkholderiaceae bacterium]|nr:inorganic triphosphatase [Burkholderiaceae bacterium]